MAVQDEMLQIQDGDEPADQLYAGLVSKSSSSTASAQERIEKKYIWVGKLGEGSFGLLWKACGKESKAEFAVKLVSPACRDHAKGRQDLLKEAILMQPMQHQHIVRVVEHFDGADALFVVMELCRGGDLHDLINTAWVESFYVHHMKKHAGVLERCAATIMAQLTSAVEYTHARCIIHGDLSPNQVLLSQENTTKSVIRQLKSGRFFQDSICVKLCDFGTAFTSYDLKPRRVVGGGTPGYRAPEEMFGTYSDIWSLGAILFFILTATPPKFQDGVALYPFVEGTGADGVTQRIKADWWEHVSDLAKNVAIRMIHPQTNKRPSAGDVLAHPWMHLPP